MEEPIAFIMVKAPVPGLVKSRMAGSIGDVAAAGVYRLMAVETMASLVRGNVRLIVSYTPRGKEDQVRELAGDGIPLVLQRGSDLGERLSNTFTDLFGRGYRKVVAVSSDVPELPARYVLDSFELLDAYDAVIGPCPDGGFYLIGFRDDTFSPDYLKGQDWGSPRVLEQTLRCLKGSSVGPLPEVPDIDTLEDLNAMMARGSVGCLEGIRRILEEV